MDFKPTASSVDDQSCVLADAVDTVFFVSVSYKGGSYDVPINSGDSVSAIFDFIQEVLDFPRENCKLISRGKVFRADDPVYIGGDGGLAPGAKLMLVATSARDKSYVQNSRPDPLVKGFAEEERDERNRQKRARAAAMSAWGTKQDAEYRFNSLKAEFKYNTPSPYDAEKLLEKLATDPGIIDIMKSRQFRVGILTEMSPAESQERMAQRGTPNMDLLGYNQNAGEKIVLKLRTDTTKGFRPYHDLINTLIHELTHNVWGPHDQNFWKLFGELKAQYMRFHNFWSRGGRATGNDVSGQFQGFSESMTDADDDQSFGRKLGGAEADGIPLSEEDKRARAIAAAQSRAAATASAGFDFLALGGKTVMFCPCGLDHSIADCPTNGVAKAEDNDEDDDDSKDTPVETRECDGNLASGAATRASEEAATKLFDACADRELAHVGQKVPEQLAMVPQKAMSSAIAGSVLIQEDRQSIDVDRTDEEPCTDAQTLTAADLQNFGLDATSEWLERFSTQLATLRAQAHKSGLANTPIELLLRLVCNIIDKPEEARFRRLRAENPKIQNNLLAVAPEAETLLKLLGFEATAARPEKMFTLRDSTLDLARLQLGREMLEQQLVSPILVR